MEGSPKRRHRRIGGHRPIKAIAWVGLLLGGITASSAVAGPIVNESPADLAAVVTPPPEMVTFIEGLTGTRAVRVEARRQLTQYPGDVVSFLIPYATDSRLAMRWEIVNLLGSLASPQGVDTLIERITGDVDPHVRWRSMWAIQRIPDPTVADRLAAICAEPGIEGWNACVGLSLFADRRAVARLHTGLSDPDGWVRWEAVDSLGRVHDEQTSNLLRPRLQDPTERIRQETVLSLAQIGDGVAIQLLEEALDDGAPGVRWRAAMGLARRAGPEELQALERRLLSETDATTRKYLQRAVQRLKGPETVSK